MSARNPCAFVRRHTTRWDLTAIVVALGAIVIAGEATRDVLAPLARLEATPLSLDPAHRPFYAARTTLRMFLALGLSLLFSFTYATWAARSPRAGKLLVPLLDILQSVPILGFISVTVVFFMSLVPGARARCGARGDLREPGLEHGFQFLPIVANHARGVA